MSTNLNIESILDGSIPQSKLDSNLNTLLNETLATKDDIPSFAGYATEDWVKNQGFLTSHQDISGKQDVLVSGINIKTVNGESLLGEGNIVIEGGESLTESDITAMGFTKNTGTYSKPTTGIPKTDLAIDIQTSLGKADTALQSYTEQYTGTITEVKVNNTSIATEGVANIPTATTGRYGVTRLANEVVSVSTSHAATSYAVKTAYDLAASKQDALVSGTNIKTINGESILGEGNLTIESNNGSAVVVHAASETEIELTPNVIHKWEEVSSLQLTIPADSALEENHYKVIFIPGDDFSLTLPSSIRWEEGEAPTFDTGYQYELSIQGNRCLFARFIAPV